MEIEMRKFMMVVLGVAAIAGLIYLGITLEKHSMFTDLDKDGITRETAEELYENAVDDVEEAGEAMAAAHKRNAPVAFQRAMEKLQVATSVLEDVSKLLGGKFPSRRAKEGKKAEPSVGPPEPPAKPSPTKKSPTDSFKPAPASEPSFDPDDVVAPVPMEPVSDEDEDEE